MALAITACGTDFVVTGTPQATPSPFIRLPDITDRPRPTRPPITATPSGPSTPAPAGPTVLVETCTSADCPTAIVIVTPVPETDTPAPPTITPTATPTPGPSLVPTTDPERVPDLVMNAFYVDYYDTFASHTIRVISGWGSGFRSSTYCQDGPYRWLDGGHLLVYPLAGQDAGFGVTEWTYPVVVSPAAGNVWLPPIEGDPGQPEDERGKRTEGCINLPLWSDALQSLITGYDDRVSLLTSDGAQIAEYDDLQGPLALSPSGRRLMAGNTWLDLDSGLTTEFDTLSPDPVFGLAWSNDETQIFRCCYHLAEASSGRDTDFDLGALTTVGIGVSPGFTGVQSTWVRDDDYTLISWGMVAGNIFGVVPLIDPYNEEYYDLRYEIGIGANNACRLTSISPNHQLAWMTCGSAAYLVDLRDFDSHTFQSGDLMTPLAWSSDNRYLLLSERTETTDFWLLDISSGELRYITSQPAPAPAWRPGGEMLAYLTEDGRTLIILNVNTNEIQVLSLPCAFSELYWDPQGSSLAMRGCDGGLWWLPATGSSDLQVLTPGFGQMRDVRWSPDGGSLAFVSGDNIYVVEVR